MRADPVLYVPVRGSAAAARLERGAAIVGRGAPRADGRLEVEVEGRRFRESLGANFADRVERCVERWRRGGAGGERRRLIPQAELVAVAECDLRDGSIALEYEREALLLADWIGGEALDESELRTTRSVIGELSSAPAAAAEPAPAPAAARGGRSNLWHSR